MSIPKEPPLALLVLSLFSSRWEMFWPLLLSRLESRLGRLEEQSEPLPFDQTTYYHAEFGAPLQRRLLAFETLVPQDHLLDIKLWTNALEQEYVYEGKRLFNIDPGLLTLERLVLATGKNFAHRVYLGRGIFADLTLLYQGGQWQSLPWTFRDYAGFALQSQLTTLRQRYREKLAMTRREKVP
jgi:hypothetical protein